MFRYIRYFDYFLEVFAKNISGRGLMDPARNGEFALLRSVVKNGGDSLCFIDGGANVGEHSRFFDSMRKEYKRDNYQLIAVEPVPSVLNVLRANLSGIDCTILDVALGDAQKKIDFYLDDNNVVSGQNSAIRHHYLGRKVEVQQTTIDEIIRIRKLSKVDFLKLDIEGLEYRALLGAKNALGRGLIDYIQLEYNQTWIEGGGTIKKVLGLCEECGYLLYRIKKNGLLSIPKYSFVLDDFFFCNLLLVRNGCRLPLPCTRKAIPII